MRSISCRSSWLLWGASRFWGPSRLWGPSRFWALSGLLLAPPLPPAPPAPPAPSAPAHKEGPTFLLFLLLILLLLLLLLSKRENKVAKVFESCIHGSYKIPTTREMQSCKNVFGVFKTLLLQQIQKSCSSLVSKDKNTKRPKSEFYVVMFVASLFTSIPPCFLVSSISWRIICVVSQR